jgi:hypothetical protein
MSKARARERAKARAAKKPKKREETNSKLDRQNSHEKFGNKDFSIKGPSGNTFASNSAAAKRGAARSG